MRHLMLRAVFSAAGLAVLVSGCASTAPPETSVAPPPLGSEFPRLEPADPATIIEEPRGVLLLSDALRLSLLNNPKLAVFSWEIRAREAEALQAGRMPNPELDAELENFAGTGAVSGFGGSETTIALSQLVELGGKRSDRLQLASLERDLGAWDYEARRIEVLTETTSAFIAVLAAQDQLALADELTAVADSLLQSIAVRVRAGASSAVEEMRARVSLETSQIDRARSVQLLSVARSRLSSMWGSAAPEFSSVSGDLGQIVDVPGLEVLGGRVEANPALARWSTELARRQAAIELANSNGVPDLSVGAGMRHFSESGDLGVVVGLSLPLPLFDRNQGTSAAAEARLVQAEHEQRNSETSVRTALKEVHAEASASHDEIVALRERALPHAGSAFDLVSTTYQRGRMRLTDVFDAQRTLFELRGRLVAALARYHIAVAGIERLTGAPISGADHEPRRP